ncbi:hypothetical protein MYX76_14255 [Desulfobacterota bacterium AH_259_B03_O07]|nr:hypothetical protein [Desulfobacterota bacterium AH_259_B03_O07]
MKIIASRSLYFSFFLSTLLILSSCAKTRTITPLTQSNRSNVNKIAIFVEADEEFNVSVSREKNYSVGILSGVDAGMGGVFLIPLAIVWGLTEYVIRRHIDEKHEESLEAKLTHFHPGELMTEKLQNYLELSNAGFTAEIPEVNSPSMLKAEGFDTILEVTLKEWEIKLCPKTFDRVNVWFKLSGRMILIDDSSTVWERVEFYKDENCYRIEDLKTQPELLIDILSRAIHNLAENTVNEIL